MLTRKVRIQLIAFILVALLGVSYAGFQFAGLGRLFGARGYAVQVSLADSGGIFTNAEVTYRGVAIGRVGALRLTSAGVQAELDIDSTNTKIPVDVKAVVADRSAVGEQYVDLRPNTDSGPYLADGAVIPQQHTATPLPVQNLLSSVDGFAQSVPTQSLQTVIDELDSAFQGAGPNLQALLDSTSSLTQAAQQHLPQTFSLLEDANTVLQTQVDSSTAITSFSTSLRQLADQLKNSDGDLRRLIAATPTAATQVDELLRESGPNLGIVLANLLTTSNILLPRTASISQIFVTYPLVLGGSYTVIPGDGTAHFGLALNVFDPPPCTRGYESTQKRPGNVVTPIPANKQAYCAEPQGSPIDVRGAQNAPYGGKPGVSSSIGQSTSSTQGTGQQPALSTGLLPGLSGLGLSGYGLPALLGLPG